MYEFIGQEMPDDMDCYMSWIKSPISFQLLSYDIAENHS